MSFIISFSAWLNMLSEGYINKYVARKERPRTGLDTTKPCLTKGCILEIFVGKIDTDLFSAAN